MNQSHSMVPVICFFEPTAITDIYEPSLTMTNINQIISIDSPFSMIYFPS